MIYYSGTRYMVLSRPLSFDRRALIGHSGAGGVSLDVHRQLSAVHRRQALRMAHANTPLNAGEMPRPSRRPPG